jgi:hypothetical protein
MDYEWPGNVRELENVIERSVVLATGTQLDTDLLPETLRSRDALQGMRIQTPEFFSGANGESGAPHGADNRPPLFQMEEEFTRRILLDMLERTGWNQTEAAERLQIPLSTLNQKIKRLGIEVRRRGIGRAAGDFGGREVNLFATVQKLLLRRVVSRQRINASPIAIPRTQNHVSVRTVVHSTPAECA